MNVPSCFWPFNHEAPPRWILKQSGASFNWIIPSTNQSVVLFPFHWPLPSCTTTYSRHLRKTRIAVVCRGNRLIETLTQNTLTKSLMPSSRITPSSLVFLFCCLSEAHQTFTSVSARAYAMGPLRTLLVPQSRYNLQSPLNSSFFFLSSSSEGSDFWLIRGIGMSLESFFLIFQPEREKKKIIHRMR